MDKIKILLIEDESIISKNLKIVFENFGYEVVDIVTTCEEALEVAYNNTLDLVISDIEIRGLADGIETCKILQNTYNLPIIFITAYNDQEKIKRASEIQNMVGYLIKPIRIDELNSMIKIAALKYGITKKDTLLDINGIYSYDMEKKVLHDGNDVIILTRNENLLLSLLLNNNGNILSYEAIKDAIWNGSNGSDVSRRQLVYRLKTKLEKIEIVSQKGEGIFIKE
jgi:DNA-binding response OmpR family regulator